MFWKVSKLLLAAGIAGLALLALAFGSDAISYLCTFWQAGREKVRDQVSVDLELQRAKLLIEDVGPELARCRRELARSEVALEDLDVEIGRLETRLAQRDAALERVAVRKVGFAGSDAQVADSRLAAEWARELEAARRDRALLEAKRSLRAKQVVAVDTARERLAAVGGRRAELEDAIRGLHVQKMQVETLEATVPSIGIDESSLARASDLIVQIERRLRVRERACEQELALPSAPSSPERDPLLVAAEIEAYLASVPRPDR